MSKAPGVTSTEVGYTGGIASHPTYEQVCSGTTGHAEAVKITFDEKRTSYKLIVRRFLESYNPWVDLSSIQGGQYRTAVFYLTPEQGKLAKEAISEFEAEKKRPVATRVEPAGPFWRAEEYHQNYYKKHGLGVCRLF